MLTNLAVRTANNIDLNAPVEKFRLLAIGILGIGLIVCSAVGVFKFAAKGHTSRGAAMVLTVLICLIPAGIGTGFGAIALGHNILGWSGF